ncbi:MAG TPA: Uma2 family endonuclease [Longimicrobiales bacterium]|nr:Uma2 family endonuclease [Longimicrobiales bacterium]
MDTSPRRRRFTIEEYVRLPEEDEWWLELSRGRLVREPRPGGEHADITGNVYVLLRRFVEAHQLGRVVVEGGFRLPLDHPTVRGPDVAFIRTARLPAAVPVGFWELAPDLAIEVISPSNRAGDLREKLADYADAGVTEVWLIRPRTRSVDIYRHGHRVSTYRSGDALTTPLLPGFGLRVSDIFA